VNLSCNLWQIVYQVLNVYMILMLVYAVVSWIPSIRGRWSDFVAMLVEPVLTPVRRVIPPLGGLDLSFLLVIIVIQLVNMDIVRSNLIASCTYI
jgi:YggT family protein